MAAETRVLYYAELRARVLVSAVRHIQARTADDVHIVVRAVVSELFANSERNPEWQRYLSGNAAPAPQQRKAEAHVGKDIIGRVQESRTRQERRRADTAGQHTRVFLPPRGPQRQETAVSFLPLFLGAQQQGSAQGTTAAHVLVGRRAAFETQIAGDVKGAGVETIVMVSQNLLRKLYGVPRITEDMMRGVARGSTGIHTMAVYAVSDATEGPLDTRALDQITPLLVSYSSTPGVDGRADGIKRLFDRYRQNLANPGNPVPGVLRIFHALEETLEQQYAASRATLAAEEERHVDDIRWPRYSALVLALLLTRESADALARTGRNVVAWARRPPPSADRPTATPALIGVPGFDTGARVLPHALADKFQSYIHLPAPRERWTTRMNELGGLPERANDVVPLFVRHVQGDTDSTFRLYVQRALVGGHRIIDVVHVNTGPALTAQVLLSYPHVEHVLSGNGTGVTAVVIHQLVDHPEPPHVPGAAAFAKRWAAWSRTMLRLLRAHSLQGLTNSVLRTRNVRNQPITPPAGWEPDRLRRPTFVSPSLLQRLSMDAYYTQHAMRAGSNTQWLLLPLSLAVVEKDWTAADAWAHVKLSNTFAIQSKDVPRLTEANTDDEAVRLTQRTVRHALDDVVDALNGVTHPLARTLRIRRRRAFQGKMNADIRDTFEFKALFQPLQGDEDSGNEGDNDGKDNDGKNNSAWFWGMIRRLVIAFSFVQGWRTTTATVTADDGSDDDAEDGADEGGSPDDDTGKEKEEAMGDDDAADIARGKEEEEVTAEMEGPATQMTTVQVANAAIAEANTDIQHIGNILAQLASKRREMKTDLTRTNRVLFNQIQRSLLAWNTASLRAHEIATAASHLATDKDVDGELLETLSVEMALMRGQKEALHRSLLTIVKEASPGRLRKFVKKIIAGWQSNNEKLPGSQDAERARDNIDAVAIDAVITRARNMHGVAASLLNGLHALQKAQKSLSVAQHEELGLEMVTSGATEWEGWTSLSVSHANLLRTIFIHEPASVSEAGEPASVSEAVTTQWDILHEILSIADSARDKVRAGLNALIDDQEGTGPFVKLVQGLLDSVTDVS